MRPNLHQSNPPIPATRVTMPKMRPKPERCGVVLEGMGGVSVCGARVADGEGVAGIVVGLGVSVAVTVTGITTRRSNF